MIKNSKLIHKILFGIISILFNKISLASNIKQFQKINELSSSDFSNRINVKIVITTENQQNLLSSQPDISFNAIKPESLNIKVDDKTTYQQLDGFGASITDSAGWEIWNSLNVHQRNELMEKLFSATKGIGISWLRQPMGSSDFSTAGNYSYDDLPAGKIDPDMLLFSIAHDKDYIIPLLKQAININPALKVSALPWSPPAWMKTNRNMNAGQVDNTYYYSLANYFVKFIQAYQSQGIPIYAISTQNEPLNTNPNYPTSLWTPNQEAEFIGKYLGPALKKAGVQTKIMTYDHNWDVPSYPLTVLNNQLANSYIAGSAWHCYAGNSSAQVKVHEAFPNKGIWFTECSGGEWSTNFADNLKWGVRTLLIENIRNWTKSVSLWNLALNQDFGPINGGCKNCRGIVTINNTISPSLIKYNVEYYVLGHISKFVEPGAYRIASNTYGDKSIEDVAFKNPDGSIVVLVLNSADTSRVFSISWNNLSFPYVLPGGAVATFRWEPFKNDHFSTLDE